MEFWTKLALALSEVSFLDLLDDNDWKFWDHCDTYTFKNHTFEYSIYHFCIDNLYLVPEESIIWTSLLREFYQNAASGSLLLLSFIIF